MNGADIATLYTALEFDVSLNMYDDEGRLISEEYIDASDNPVCNKQGFAAHYISYTESGLIQDEYYLNENETPAAVEGEDNHLGVPAVYALGEFMQGGVYQV